MTRLPTYLIMLALTVCSAIVSGEVVLRTTVTPEPAWVGQRVILRIDVLGDSGWAQITRFGDIDLAGAYVMRTDSQGMRLQETIDSTSYTGQRYELSIYPQVDGMVEVPAIPVTVTTKGWGPDAAENVQQANTQPATITARLPPGVEDASGLISTPQLIAEQEWQPSLEAAKVGDAFKRTITLQATDVSAMAFTPLQHTDIPGVGIYPSEPTVMDSTDRGSLTGKRIEVLTYVLERAGEVRIPDIVLAWWNLTDRKLERVELPGQLLNVAVGPVGASGVIGSSAARQFETRALWLFVIMLVVSATVLLRFRKGMAQRWAAWRKHRNESEARYFRQALKSLRSREAGVALRDVMRWLDRINDQDRPAKLEDFLSRYGDAEMQNIARKTLHELGASDERSNTSALIAGFSSARNQWLKQRRVRKALSEVLPELNRI